MPRPYQGGKNYSVAACFFQAAVQQSTITLTSSDELQGFPSEIWPRLLALTQLHSSPPIRVEAWRFIRKMRGGSQTHLIETADGSPYVVKFTNNPQHPRVVINEWVASTVLRQLGISTPVTAIVELSAGFISKNPELYIQLASGRVPPACGSHFGSRFAGESARTVYDQLPEAVLGNVANLSDFCGALVADKWLGNTDARQSVFIKIPSIGLAPSFVVQMIDNGQMFDGGNWRFNDSPLRGPYAGRVYQHVRSLEEFEPWLTAVSAFPEAVLGEALQQLPRSWLSGDTLTAFGVLVHQLMRRRERVRSLIDACRTQPTNPFPNWSS